MGVIIRNINMKYFNNIIVSGKQKNRDITIENLTQLPPLYNKTLKTDFKTENSAFTSRMSVGSGGNSARHSQLFSNNTNKVIEINTRIQRHSYATNYYVYLYLRQSTTNTNLALWQYHRDSGSRCWGKVFNPITNLECRVFWLPDGTFYIYYNNVYRGSGVLNRGELDYYFRLQINSSSASIHNLQIFEYDL